MRVRPSDARCTLYFIISNEEVQFDEGRRLLWSAEQMAGITRKGEKASEVVGANIKKLEAAMHGKSPRIFFSKPDSTRSASRGISSCPSRPVFLPTMEERRKSIGVWWPLHRRPRKGGAHVIFSPSPRSMNWLNSWRVNGLLSLHVNWMWQMLSWRQTQKRWRLS